MDLTTSISPVSEVPKLVRSSKIPHLYPVSKCLDIQIEFRRTFHVNIKPSNADCTYLFPL